MASTEVVYYFLRYECPDDVGWLGWIEDIRRRTVAYVGLDKRVYWVLSDGRIK